MEINKKRALTLAGGGALGAYEVGAIQALEELGYSFDIVTGTSIGALNASFVKSKETDRLYDLWSNITAEKVMVNGLDFKGKMISNPTSGNLKDMTKWAGIYIKGKLGADITPFKKYIKNCVNVDKALSSEIKMGIVTTSFPSMRLVDVDMDKIDKDDYLAYLHASSACFPIFPVETIGKKTFVDGFYNDNLPIRLAFDFGAKDVIAIDMKLFDLKPQHSFYTSLPNVEYIAPYTSLGSMMDFSQESIQKRIKLGYLDVLKHFKKIRGFSYSIKGEIPCDGFISDFLKAFSINSEHIIKALSNGVRRPMDEVDYYVRSVELIASKLKIDRYYDEMDINEFKKIIKEKALEMYKEKKKTKNTFVKAIDKLSEELEFKSAKVLAKYCISFGQKYLDLSTSDGKPLLSDRLFLNGSVLIL